MAGIALPQLAPASEDRVSGALSVDGSLRFDDTAKHYLTQTIGNGTSGFTISCWMKPCQTGNRDEIFDTVASTGFYLYRHTDGSIRINNNTEALFTSNGLYRDTTAFYNIVFSYDSTSGYGSLYVNGRLDKTTKFSTQLYAGTAKISSEASNDPANYYLGQWYLIDGQALGPGYFGYTDALTGTWRPKKFKAEGTTVNDGTRWRTYLSASNGSFHADPYGATAAFNGTVGSSSGGYCQAANGTANPNSITFDVSSIGGIPFKNSVEVWLINNANTVSVNGGVPQSIAGETFVQVARGPGVLNTIKFERPSTNGASLGTIRVDGVNLRDDLTQNLAFGSEGFYLPLDGSSPIGQDRSGNGNDWTPVNFGGSAALDKATGAKPILNTGNGGNVARPGVFGSEVSSIIAVTVSNATGNNKYYLDSVLNPSLAFIRGGTITFDTTDSSNNNHPFKLSSTNADSSSGTEYTDGVAYYINGSTVTGSDYVSNYSNNGGGTGFRGIKWTIPHNVSTTYYYCTSHAGMGNNGRLTSTTDETKADPYAWKCVVAMPLVSTNSDVSDHINSTSSIKTVTTQNNAAAIYSRSNFYGGSFDFDGSGDRLVLSNYGSDLSFAGDFTMECWLYIDDSASLSNPNGDRCIAGVWSGTNGDWLMTYSGTGDHNTFLFQIYTGGSTVFFSSGVVMTPYVNRWVHLAVVRNSNSVQCFVDGIAKGSATSNSASFGQTSNVAVGGRTSGDSHTVTGSIQDLRIYNGVAKYTSNFIPASTDPDILSDSPSGVGVKAKLTKITDGAVSFDGVSGTDGDYLRTPVSSSDFTFGTGDFTIEMFLYNRETAGKGFIQISDTAGGLKATNSGVVTIHKENGQNGVFRSYAKDTSTAFSTPVPYKRWCHVALVRESGTIKLFVDGKQDATTITNDTTNYATTYVAIGGYYDTDYLSDCTISNVRVNKGTALYTSDFIPPTRALTNVTNTKLLCCQSNTEAGRAAVSPSISGPNTGTQWSKYLTGGGGFQANYPATNAFNGTVTGANTSRSTNSQVTQTFTPPGGIKYSSKVEVWTWYTGNVSLNGGSNVGVADEQDWTTIATGSGTINNIRFIANSGNNVYIAGIRVDNTILLDPVTPNGEAAPTNFNPFTTNINTVRGQEGAYPTINPLYRNPNGGGTLTNGNLTHTTASGNGQYNASVAIKPNTGRFYWEVTKQTSSNVGMIGITNMGLSLSSYNANNVGSFSWYIAGPRKQTSGVDANYGSGVSQGDVVGVAYDSDSRELRFYLNGEDQGVAFDSGSIAEADYYPAFSAGSSSTVFTYSVNFGQKPFKFPPPDGYQPLTSSASISSDIVPNPSQFCNTVLYTGTGGDLDLDVGFQPDLSYFACRSATGYIKYIFDSVRGPTNYLATSGSQGDDAQGSSGSTLKSFNSNGVTIGNNTQMNENASNTWASWHWKAGGAPTATNNNTSGAMDANSVSIDGVLQSAYTPSGSPSIYPKKMSIGTKQGFSIIQWTDANGAQTLPHGLSQAPDFILIKDLGASVNWSVYHKTMGNGKAMYLNNADDDFSTSRWNSTSPTANVFSWNDNTSTNDQIAYCWHDVPGMQKFGFYKGTGQDDGPFVDLGFKPAMLWVKCSSHDSQEWLLWDNKRSPHNLVNTVIYPHTNTSESDNGTSRQVDFLSNGFKMRNGGSGASGIDGRTYLYMAWAESAVANLYGATSPAR